MGRSITSRRGRLPAPRVFANDSSLTQFSGLVPFIRFLVGKLDIVSRLVRVAPSDGRKLVFKRHLVLLTFLVGAVAGVERLDHLAWLRGDAVLVKFLRLPRWPVRKVFSQALAGVTDRGIAALQALIADVGLAPLRGQGRAVLDVDSSAIVAFGAQEGTCFGYSGKGRNRRRHHPLVASVAETRAVVHADYRDGSAIDAEEAIAFVLRSLTVMRGILSAGAEVILRADSGFWSNKMGAWLMDQEVPFIFSLPLRPGVKLMLRATRWRGLDGDPDIQGTVIPGARLGMDPRLRVLGIRRRVFDAKAPPQGKRIDGCERWRYQALVTVMTGQPDDLWRFYNGRADCERIFKVARKALGMGRLVGQQLRANETAFLLRILAFNADLRFQAHAEERAAEAGQPAMRMGLVARQRRFFNAAGRLLRTHGRWVLRVRDNPVVERLWAFYAPELLNLE